MTNGIKQTSQLIDVPLALASDGTMLVSITHLEQIDDVAAVIARLIGEGHRLFIGVAVPGALRAKLLRDVDDGLADVVGRLGVRVLRRPRRP